MTDLIQRLVDLERRLARVEANRGASLRYGTVTESNSVGSARVQLHDGDGMVSFPVRTLHRRTLKDQDQCLPDLGEQVAVLFAGQGMEEGCVLGAVYSQQDQAPGQEQPVQFYQFEDGTVISYDRVQHRYFADIKGAADITILQDATVTIKEDATVTVEGQTTLHGREDVLVRSEARLILEGRGGIWLRAPGVVLEGLDGEVCQTTLHTDLYLRGLLDHRGDVVREGDVTHQGGLVQTGNQDVTGTITASGEIHGAPVTGCEHE
ncbi:phage baseplate assembly protein V [Megalodesulfovibrio paquesii]